MSVKKIISAVCGAAMLLFAGNFAFAEEAETEKSWNTKHWSSAQKVTLEKDSTTDEAAAFFIFPEADFKALRDDEVITFSAYTGDHTEDAAFLLSAVAKNEAGDLFTYDEYEAQAAVDSETGEKYAAAQVAFTKRSILYNSEEYTTDDIVGLLFVIRGELKKGDTFVVAECTIGNIAGQTDFEEVCFAEDITPFNFSYDPMVTGEGILNFLCNVDIIPLRDLAKVEDDEEICAFAYTESDTTFSVIAEAVDKNGNSIGDIGNISQFVTSPDGKIMSACELKFTKEDIISMHPEAAAEDIESIRIYLAGGFDKSEEIYFSALPYKTLLANAEDKNNEENPATGVALPALTVMIISAASALALKKKK